ncbi:MAG: hypothetical protein DRP50_00345 [Thermotoga sp.]|nr:MAG: hypothetical protein DRP50_00345 [Thermotoga sp.]
MKRAIILLVVMLVIVPLFSSADTITVWFSWEGQKQFQSVVDDFNTVHPNSHVELVYIPEMIQKLRITLSSGSPLPDVALVRNNDLGILVDAGVIKPAGKVNTTPSFYKSFLVNGVEYAYPYYADVQVVYVNKNLFKGISFPSLNWRLSDLENIASKLKENGYIGIVFSKNSPYFFNSFNAAFSGGKIPEKDGIVLVNTPGTLKAAELFKSLFDVKKIAVSYKKMALINAFKTGKAGMMLMGSFLIPDFLDSKVNFTILPYPILDDGRPIPPVFDSKGFVVFRESREVKDFIDYVTSTEKIEKFCRQNYKIPSNVNAIRALEGENEFFKVMSMSAERSLILPTSKVFKNAYVPAVSTALSLYLNGELSLKEAFSKAQEYINNHIVEK